MGRFSNERLIRWKRKLVHCRFFFFAIVMAEVMRILAANGATAAEKSAVPQPVTSEHPAYSVDAAIKFSRRLMRFEKGTLVSRIDLPSQPRVSRSNRPLRQITLVGGDHFVGECLDWGSKSVDFRLLSGQTIAISHSAIAMISNPPGEVDLVTESFETDSNIKSDPLLRQMLDETQASGGLSSLRIDATSTVYRKKLDRPIGSARIEFAFQISGDDLSSPYGEWQLDWDKSVQPRKPLVVRIESDRLTSIDGITPGTQSISQRLRLSNGWHSFVALISPDRIRLIVDDAILASFPSAQPVLSSISFRPSDAKSKNSFWIDELQIRSLGPSDELNPIRDESNKQDKILTESGDELFGRVAHISEKSVAFEATNDKHALVWQRVKALSWHQPAEFLAQHTEPQLGIVSKIEMQPFVDRPECLPEQWTVTVTESDATNLTVQHSFGGELTLRWSDIRRIEPQYFGRMQLIDARRFHLGNSIRTDFHRHLPDGTEVKGEFWLKEIPSGNVDLSLEVAELEAAGPDAPPSSPFLSQLRAGKLVTEVQINEQRIADLNKFVRFKALPQTPDRIRIAIPRGILNQGRNTFRLRQHPLNEQGREFDDCEVGVIQLEIRN